MPVQTLPDTFAEFQTQCPQIETRIERYRFIASYFQQLVRQSIVSDVPKDLDPIVMVDVMIDTEYGHADIFDHPIAYSSPDGQLAPFFAMMKLLSMYDTKRSNWPEAKQVKFLDAVYNLLKIGQTLLGVPRPHELHAPRAHINMSEDGPILFERERFIYALPEHDTPEGLSLIASRRSDRGFAIPAGNNIIDNTCTERVRRYLNDRERADTLRPFVDKVAYVLRR